MKYIHVKNIEKYHPAYKDRELIWCKTYFTMVNADPGFEMLTEVDKWRFIAFVMLELQIKKPIPIDDEYFTRKGFDLKSRPISLTIQMLHNFIECVTEDSKVCTESVTHIRVDKSREDKEENRDRGRFAPPTQEEVISYFKELNSDNTTPINFFDYFSANGWLVGGRAKMKDWRAAARRWERNKHQFQKPDSGEKILVNGKLIDKKYAKLFGKEA